ncbi:hypothetical protein M9H77_31906 [Catharanthus roseus]|uniref:Uncharacterized protein n=1 Tax=Catharanthus roseus TaxID=4058 RepID=A0ACC0A3H0_CATRO|nr:hypothetical protein M9H77_31906 [Catharanthus roseus]
MKMKLWLVACYFATVTVAMGTQLDAPAPKDCSNIVMEMVPCLSFMTDAKTTKPTQACCQGLEKVIDFDKTCVCFALNFAPSMGIAVNISKAEVLASLCKVNDAPPVSSCHLTPSPTPTPPAPEPSPPVKPPAPAPPTPGIIKGIFFFFSHIFHQNFVQCYFSKSFFFYVKIL